MVRHVKTCKYNILPDSLNDFFVGSNVMYNDMESDEEPHSLGFNADFMEGDVDLNGMDNSHSISAFDARSESDFSENDSEDNFSVDEDEEYSDDNVSDEEDGGNDNDDENIPQNGDEEYPSANGPFPNEKTAILFIFFFGTRRGFSIGQMKHLWILFEKLKVNVPTLASLLKLRKMVGIIQPEARTTSTGEVVFVRPVVEQVKRLFSNPMFSKELRSPIHSTTPKEMFHSELFHRKIPLLHGLCGGTIFYSG